MACIESYRASTYSSVFGMAFAALLADRSCYFISSFSFYFLFRMNDGVLVAYDVALIAVWEFCSFLLNSPGCLTVVYTKNEVSVSRIFR